MTAYRRAHCRAAHLDQERGLRERRPDRKSIELSCVVSAENVAAHQAFIHDMHHRGFKLQTPVNLMVGSEIEIDIPKIGVVQALVRWSLGGRAGGNFLVKVDEAVIATLAEAQPSLFRGDDA
jgi:hypothetical protein